MKKSTDKISLSKTDKLCLAAFALCFLIPHIAFWAIDEAALRADEEEKLPAEIVTITPPIDCTPLVEAIDAAMESDQADPYDETIPLSRELQAVLRDVCGEHGVPVHLVLGLIEAESCFDPEADNGLCYGLMQLNKRYYPDRLTPAENIRAGVAHLAGQIKRYDSDIQAALRGYNKGWDDGDRVYSKIVLDASEKWGLGDGQRTGVN